MDAKTFAANWALHKDDLMSAFCDVGSETFVNKLIGEMNLDPRQLAQVREVLDTALTDTMYSLLLGLDGESSIGGDQRSYQIVDKASGQSIAGPGELEAAAYEVFHKDD